MSQRNSKLITILIACISLFVIGSRFYTKSPYLYTFDSVNYALSLEEYNIGLHQPHPPGYLLYSFSLRVVNWIVRDANLTMILFNVASTIGACIFLMLLVIEMLGPIGENRAIWIAAGAAAIYATNPISWFYGSIAEIYPVEGFFSAVIAYLVIVSFRRPSFLIYASAMLAIAGGFRPTTEVFLFPLYVFGLWKKDRKTILISLTVLVVLNAAWIAALLSLTGGFSRYMEKVIDQTSRSAAKTSMFADENPQRGPSVYSIPILLLQAVTIPLFCALLIRLRRLKFSRQQMILFVLILPPLLFFFFVHFAKDGYLLLVIPILVALCIVLLERAYTKTAAILFIVFIGCVTNVWIFLRSPLRPENPVNKKFVEWAVDEFRAPNNELMNARKRKYRKFFEQIARLPADKTKLFVVNFKPYPHRRFIMYYFPEDEMLDVRSKNRSFLFYRHKLRVIQAPMYVRDRLIVVIGRKKPEVSMNTFFVYEIQSYYADLSNLPKRFKLYGFPFVRK
jgi:Protein O-mannosyl-transferase TMEM260-like